MVPNSPSRLYLQEEWQNRAVTRDRPARSCAAGKGPFSRQEPKPRIRTVRRDNSREAVPQALAHPCHPFPLLRNNADKAGKVKVSEWERP